MPERISEEQRRKNMQAIKSQSNLENMVSRELWRRGYRFRKNNKKLFGKPDISIKKYKIAIFIDSCFWHSCKEHGNRPKTNQSFWDNKLARNVRRDLEVNNYYLERNWNIKRVWEHAIKKDIHQVVDELQEFIEQSKKGHNKVSP
jgi:DNA mismatch endonuclease, patch repair protein